MSKLIENYEEVTGLKTIINPVGDNVLIMCKFKNLRTLAIVSENHGGQELESVILIGHGMDNYNIPLGSNLIINDTVLPFSEYPKYILKNINNDNGLKSIVKSIKSLSKSEYSEFIKNNESVNFTEFLLIPHYFIIGYTS